MTSRYKGAKVVRARKRSRNSRTICDTEEVGMITRLSICIKGTSYLRAQKERKIERGDSAHARGGSYRNGRGFASRKTCPSP